MPEGNMQEQEQAGRARMIGYTIGLAIVGTVVVWKFVLMKLF
jgi:hypothetical protein